MKPNFYLTTEAEAPTEPLKKRKKAQKRIPAWRGANCSNALCLSQNHTDTHTHRHTHTTTDTHTQTHTHRHTHTDTHRERHTHRHRATKQDHEATLQLKQTSE